MAFIEVPCPDCRGREVVKFGRQPNGEQRYRCKNPECQRVFLLHYQDQGRLPEVQQEVMDMALNGSGVRDTARVLGISQMTGLGVVKKKEPALRQVKEAVLKTRSSESFSVVFQKVEEAEVDEMGSYVGSQATPRGLWHAIDHGTGTVLAYVVGRRQDEVFLE